MSKVLIWIGKFQSKGDFERYMDQSAFRKWWADNDEDNLELSCQFCKEVGIDCYDEDLLIMNFCHEGINGLLNLIPANTDKLISVINEKGIQDANAVICYNCGEDISLKKASNALSVTFLGSFKFDLTYTGTHATKIGLKYMTWIGTTDKSHDAFMEYFNQDLYLQEMKDYEEGRTKKRPNPEHRCQFCKDLNIKYYYPEFLRVLFAYNNESILELVKRILDDEGFEEEVLEFLIDKYCTVKSANCVFCYIPNGYRDKKKDQKIYILKDGWEVDRHTPKTYLKEQDNYNGLKYMVTISRSN